MKLQPGQTGMYGIWNDVSNQFIFGIQETTKTKAWNTLYRKIGSDAYKYRFRAKRIHESKAHHFRKTLIYREVRT